MLRSITLIAVSAALSGCNMLPEEGGTVPSAKSVRSAKAPSSKAAGQCLLELGETGSTFSPVPDQYFGGGCSTVNSVRLADLRGDTGVFSLGNLGPVTCPLATRFAAWGRYGVDRAARQILGSGLARIETMGSYSCRNVAGTGRRSAHSRAEAIDVGGFVLADGRRISVLGDWSGGSAAEREFLRVVHRSACKRFGTVLGPDYNAAHRDHFHLERNDSGTELAGFCR